MKKFSLLFPGKIIFGFGALSKLARAEIPGKNGIIITGRKSMKKSGVLAKVKSLLKKQGKKTIVFDCVEPEVSVETVDRAAAAARKQKSDFVVGLGGGSAIDCAKAVSGILKDKYSVKDYLDGKRKIKAQPAFFAAIPSTAGTGSEVTKNAVLTYTEKRIKISLRGEKLVPKLVIADPNITVTMNRKITAYTGMDALTHAIESYFSTGATKLTKGTAATAVRLIVKNLPLAYKSSRNMKARYNMLLASLGAGLSFANAGLGAVHGIGHPAGAILKLPHGAVNAVLLPAVLEFNRRKIRKELEELEKFTGSSLIKTIRKLNRSLGIPTRLSGLKAGAKFFKNDIINTTVFTGSMSYNPVKMDRKKVIEILDKVL